MARKVRRSPARRIGPFGWAAIGCGGVVLAALVTAAVVWALATSQPVPPPEATDAYTGAPTGAATEQAASGSDPNAASPAPASPPPATPPPPLEVQLQEVHATGRSSQPVQVGLTITEDAINALVREHAGGEVQDPRVYFGDGTVVTTGTVRWQGRDFYITVRGHPVVVNESVEVAVDEVLVGRVPAPAQMYDQASRRINRGLDELLARERVQVQSVEVRPGVMTVTGRAGGRG